MTINLSALSQATTTAQALANLILVSPQDIGIQPQALATETTFPKKFVFHFYGEQSILLESDITDHYVEDNTAVQDQIALRPELYMAHGFIGELNDVVPDILQPLKTAADKLTVVSAYTPGLSITALLAYNTANQLYQVAQLAAQSGVGAWNALAGGKQTVGSIQDGILTPGEGSQTKQQVAFQTFYGYFRQRRLFTVQTPWAIFKNMALKSVRPVQAEDTRVISDFELTFKPIKFASTSTIIDVNPGQGRFNNQFAAGQSPVDGGSYTPPAAPLSLTQGIAGIA